MDFKNLFKVVFVLVSVLLILSSFSFAKNERSMNGKVWDEYDKDLFLLFKQNHKDYFVVKFCEDLDNLSLQRLDDEGVMIVDEFDDKYIVRFDSPKYLKKDFVLMNKSFACNVELYDESWKLSSALKDEKYFSWAVDGEDIWLYISLFEDANLSEVTDILLEKGFVVNDSIEDTYTLLVKSKIKQINKLASIEQVNWIEQVEAPSEDKIYDVRSSLEVDALHSSFFSLTGKGVRILQYENWVPFLHDDYKDRLILPEKHNNYGAHSTVGAGIMIGDGSIDSNMRGIAPEAEIVAKGSVLTNYRLMDWVKTHKNYLKNYNVDLSNNAWGMAINELNAEYECEFYGVYGLYQRNIDSFVNNYGLPVIWAAGNERGRDYCDDVLFDYDLSSYKTILPKAASKNVIAVGSVELGSNKISSTSSWGPTKDGRLKPEVVAPGCKVGHQGMWSTSTENDYSNISKVLLGLGTVVNCGTSISTFETSGVVTLMVENMKNEFGDNYKTYPSTVKALLVDSAIDLRSDGSGREVLDGPDFVNGYGLINPKEAIDMINSENIIEDEISKNNNSHKYYIYAKEGEDLKVTLAWDDLPQSIFYLDRVIVNDLDLYVLSPSGKKFYPWSFNEDEYYAVRDKENVLDNLEQVYVSSDEVLEEGSGNWIVVVNGSKVKKKFNQKYSLVSGNGFGWKEENANELPEWFYDGLVAYYPFNGNANDESGNGLDGQIIGASLVEDRNGEADSALYFDGVGDKIVLPGLEGEAWHTIKDKVTVSMWVKLERNNNESQVLLTIARDGSSIAYRNTGVSISYNSWNDSRLAFAIGQGTYNKNNDYRVCYSNKINLFDDKLHHISGVWNEGSYYKIYLDGDLIQECNNTHLGDIYFSSINDFASIGNEPMVDRLYTRGVIDDVSVWNRQLDKKEIEYLYNQ